MRLAVVTGGAGTIGRAVGRALRAAGFDVALWDLGEGLEEAAEAVGAAPVRVDLTDPASRAAALEAHRPPDALVHSAGIGHVVSWDALTPELWERTLAVNLTAPLFLTQEAARIMAPGGSIVAIGSVSGALAGAGRLAYGTSKAGLAQMVRQYAVELAPRGLTVNAVLPGPVDGPLARAAHPPEQVAEYLARIPQRRYAKPEEVASAVAFLCGPGARHITGQAVAVDGGYLAAGVGATLAIDDKATEEERHVRDERREEGFETSDGARLSYLEAGSGQPFVMIPGWSQTAQQWHAQIERFKDTHRVIALDMRGHGESEKVEHGYRIARLAKDLREVIVALDLHDAVLMGHSMGSSIIWGYYDLWGADRIAGIVHCDQSPFLSDNIFLTDEEKAQGGAIFTNEATFDTVAALAGPDGEATTRGFIASMFTPDVDAEILDEVVRLNLAFPRRPSGHLIVNHVYNDWRDVIRRIDVPYLAIGGEASIVPVAGIEWAASVVPGAELEIVEADQGGSHFMFMQNPGRLNERVAAFLSGPAGGARDA